MVAVDGPLDRPQQRGLPLHLVHRDPSSAAHEAQGVAPGHVEDVEIVERRVDAAAGGRPLHERALTRLPGAADDNGGHHREPFAERRSREPGGVSFHSSHE